MPNLLLQIKNNKIFKTLLRIFIALLISLTLTILCVLFTPSIFNSTLHKGLALLPKNKFVEYKVQTKTELAHQWLEESDALKDDKLFFDQLRTTLPSTRNKDTFFAHMFVVHEYPAPCFFTIFGKHRTMDVTWTVQGIRCKGAKQCNDPLFIKNCPPPKRHHK
ncbi:MAG: hypothetical protein V7782_16585 [Psychromonas sp.]